MSGRKFGYEADIRMDVVECQEAEKAYGPWHKSYQNSFVSLYKTDSVPDVVSDFDIHVGKTCYVVWLEYDIGDSFGESERGAVEVIGVFNDKKYAEELKNKIVKHYSLYLNEKLDCDERYGFHFKTSDGQQFIYKFCPWLGYFEHLRSVYVEDTIVKERNM